MITNRRPTVAQKAATAAITQCEKFKGEIPREDVANDMNTLIEDLREFPTKEMAAVVLGIISEMRGRLK